MTVATRKRLLTWSVLVAVLLLAANAFVAIQQLGSGAGRKYHWICQESGAELSYSPSEFGSACLVPEKAKLEPGQRWELVDPQPPSAFLPWNWLAIWLERPAPDPETVIRHQNLGAN